ncbi:YebC/PmpR family DNA-binding transcriptional regulator [Aestuariicella hydrocarbonica]|uniref:Probable transcriptional regulatory protein G8770_01120 n=1 Tax=Pseudomaricurvus hydrocarbonicus TaxID=1470433 RepID=A0A9E5JRS4_9GAMM|nr:YebC/PmpR family DNA-binding transcriptional regulator [Aestuariicella hydrocarbonica]NHO64144.1 YebC/PmpR family DNA-binding transcriptional regulator [Aestuariicella hydrocarbonica]
MAGHSKWANIRHRKAAQDAKRGKIFTKLIRELVVAAKGGADPADNPRLRAAVDKALAANMKRDTVDKAIARGAGNADGDNYDELTYEGYAPGGVAILVECMTDNRNRTVSDVRHAFTKRGGNLGTDGSVAYLFTRQGQIFFSDIDEDTLMEAALEVGAEDVEMLDGGGALVTTAFEDFLAVKDGLQARGLMPDSAEVSMEASVKVPLDAEASEKVMAMVDALEDLDDVQNVYTNAEFDESAFGE